MLISEALSAAAALTGQSVDAAAAVRWLSELDGRLAFELYRMAAWTPYDPTDDLGSALLVPFPWDGLYVHHLEAMTYFTDGEYDRYENARVLSEQTLAEFRAFLRRSLGRPVPPPGNPGGSAVTVIPARSESPFFWLSAYALAVKHGFEGGEEAWLASLVGPKGDPGGATPADVAATRQMLAPILSDPAGTAVSTGQYFIYDNVLRKALQAISSSAAAATFTGNTYSEVVSIGGMNDATRLGRAGAIGQMANGTNKTVDVPGAYKGLLVITSVVDVGCGLYFLNANSSGSVFVFPIKNASGITFDTATAKKLKITNGTGYSIFPFTISFSPDYTSVQ